jgi:hypothetical protein
MLVVTSTAHVIFQPLDFITRLVALVPKPRVNLTRFHGVFASNSQHRTFARRTASIDDVGATPQVRLQHRYRDLSCVAARCDSLPASKIQR